MSYQSCQYAQPPLKHRVQLDQQLHAIGLRNRKNSVRLWHYQVSKYRRYQENSQIPLPGFAKTQIHAKTIEPRTRRSYLDDNFASGRRRKSRIGSQANPL
ncbi:hypothetical protein [Massilia sp. YIM B04103]|uniref:hypothetical protein n=1 Tax=Massilia sp. YIM B04103 TaxID=2963106 RepID=UPI00210D8076|nr:hypothetical protein [Massilia sp. YIM B04103]